MITTALTLGVDMDDFKGIVLIYEVSVCTSPKLQKFCLMTIDSFEYLNQ